MDVYELQARITAIESDMKNFVKYPNIISPAIGCKVAYDEHGFILRSVGLDASDIPDIQITQVTGLQKRLDSVIDQAALNNAVADIKKSIIKRSTKVASTGVKINYDENGFVVSHGDLLADDIPQLPMSKIEGLTDILSIIDSISKSTTSTTEETSVVSAGTYTKVTVDNTGRVVKGDQISTNDIPSSVFTEINRIAAIIPTLASQSTMDGIVSTMSKKVNVSGVSITPGTYTKVTIDNQGLVISADQAGVDDLPEISIDNISGLREELSSFAYHSDFVNLNNTVSSLFNTVSNIGDVSSLRTEVSLKASEDDVERLKKEFVVVRDTVSELVGNDEDIDFIKNQLVIILDKLSDIDTRLNKLESNSSI